VLPLRCKPKQFFSKNEGLNGQIIKYGGTSKSSLIGMKSCVIYKTFQNDYKAVSQCDIPPSFTQDIMNIDDCVIFWNSGIERKALPEECIGLERSAVWDEQDIVERIEDHYKGQKNFSVERDKVILTKDDPRYTDNPRSVRWDFEKQVFYRVDK
jgi:hypothetical protein